MLRRSPCSDSSGFLRWRWRRAIWSEHLSENVFCVFQSFWHFFIAWINCLGKSICLSLTFLVDICDHFCFRWKNDLCMILKIYLDNFIRKSKHDSILCSHPLLDINNFSWFATTACRDWFLSGIFLEKFILSFDRSDNRFLSISF